MLETFVPSRIRRTLLEHILAHPDNRFYLRGLAKELSLTVSPVRRELKRLEQLGLLKAYDEANIRFYIVDQSSPLFTQLKQAAQPGLVPAGPVVASTVISHPQIERIRRAVRPRLTPLTVLGALAVSTLVILGLGGVVYLAVTNHRLLSLTRHAVSSPRPQVTVVESQPRASGAMQSSRWRLLPGAMGGFSSDSKEDSL